MKPSETEAYDSFVTHGYVVVRDVLDRSITARLHDHLQSNVDVALAILRESFPFADHKDLNRKVDAVYDDGSLASYPFALQQIMSGHFDLKTRLSAELLALLDSHDLMGLLEDALEAQGLRLHMPPVARFVLPDNRHAGVPAHQDRLYNSHMGRFVTVWVPLVPIDDLCGGVLVHHGRTDEERVTSPKDRFWFPGLPEQECRKVHCKIGPGDVILLSDMIVHESMPNRSDRIRLSIDYRFFGSHTESTKHFLDVATRTVVAPPGQ